MSKQLVALGRDCEECGKPLFSLTPNNVNPKRFCSDECRYAGWKRRNFEQLIELAMKLAKRGTVPV